LNLTGVARVSAAFARRPASRLGWSGHVLLLRRHRRE